MTRRRTALGAIALALPLLITCSDPTAPRAVEGRITMDLSTPHTDNGGVILRVSGGPVDSVRSFHPHVIVRQENETTWRVIIAGSLANGAIGDLWVPNTRAIDDYTITVLEAAARNTFAQRTALDGYTVTLRAP